MEISDLPALNATLNLVSTVLLITGYVFIRRKNKRAHRNCMLAAVATSAAFLTSYLIYHANVGSKPFEGSGPIRLVYFAILIPHVILAVAMVPPILYLLYQAWRGRFEKHRRVARWTLPVWIYVSVTGVIIYLMLYGPGSGG